MLFYWIVGLAGFLFLAISFVIGELAEGLGGLFEHEVDVNVGGHEVLDIHHDGESHTGPSLFSVRIISAFATGFGMTGVLTGSMGLNPLWAVLPSLGVGLVMALAIYALTAFFYSQQATSSFSPNELVGQIAEISLPVPQNGLGEVSFVLRSATQHFSVRSANGEPINGGSVKVTGVSGNILIVEPKN